MVFQVQVKPKKDVSLLDLDDSLRRNEISCLRESRSCFLKACERQVWPTRGQLVFLFIRACFYSAQPSFQPVSALLD
ncbi:unnamed protein product [Tetraodon nigroviridis]|uniref:(spotted green pufferfish) hypothetical protein n=1 Tax=Tetraodon nigroviridis TaxID=99883 RepID=Q4T4C9_TETNG|nr:unnamed protein product [Tetraodon nigroviridis]